MSRSHVLAATLALVLALGSALALTTATAAGPPAADSQAGAPPSRAPLSFPSEATPTVALRPGPVPDPLEYVQTGEWGYPNPEASFNGAERTTLRHVRISGLSIVFDPADDRQALNPFAGNEDLGRLEIFAEEVVIRAGLELPGTDVVIHAERLRFEDVPGATPARIITLPRPFTHAAAAAQGDSPGRDGLPGQRGGHLELIVENLELQELDWNGVRPVRFLLSGGAGQDPGPGRAGDPGQDYDSLGPLWGKGRTASTQFDDVIYRQCQVFAGNCTWGQAKKAPTNGGHAVAGGRPGAGGPGGVLTTSLDVAVLAERVQQQGGAPGLASPPYAGGAAGAAVRRGRRSQSWQKIVDDGLTVWRTSGGKTVAGRGAAGKSSDPGSPGRIAAADPDMLWLAPAVLQARVDYLRDAHLTGHVDLAVQIAVEHLERMTHLPERVRTDPATAPLHLEVLRIATLLNAGTDYFGNPAGWVPLLPLEVVHETYASQIDDAVRVLSMAHWLEIHWDEREERLRMLKQLQNANRSYRDQRARDHAHAQSLLGGLDAELAAVRNEANQLQSRLASEEKRFTRGRQIRKQVLAGLSAGLTALSFAAGKKGAVGVGGASGIVGALGAESGLDSQSGARAVEAGLLEPELAAAREQFARLSVLHSESAEAHQAEIERLSKILTADTKASLEAHVQAAGGTIEQAELENFKREDPKLSQLYDQTAELLTRHTLLAASVAEGLQALDAAALDVTAVSFELDALAAAERRAQIDGGARQAVAGMRRRAQDSLVRYQYYLAKAYTYRLLETTEVDFRANQLFDRLASLFGSGSGSGSGSDEVPFSVESDLFAHLGEVYRRDLEGLQDRLVQAFAEHRVDAVAVERVLSLDEAELRELNESGAVTLDLGQRLVSPEDQNVRLADMRVLLCPEGKATAACSPGDRRTHITTTGPAGSDASLEVTLEPADWALLRWQDATYLFRYGLAREAQLVSWGFVWSPHTGVRSFERSGKQADLLRLVTDSEAAAKARLRPGADTHLQIRRTQQAGAEARIERLAFVVTLHKHYAKPQLAGTP